MKIIWEQFALPRTIKFHKVQRTKHIDIGQHFLRSLVEDKVRFIKSENNSSDITTKNAPQDVHDKHTTMLKQGRLDFWKKDVKTGKAQEESMMKIDEGNSR
jgi:hypothetical protein